MEGLIPFLYRAIMRYRVGGRAAMAGAWFDDTPSVSYMRLQGDSARFQSSETQLSNQDHIFSSSSTSSMSPSASQLLLSAVTQSPLSRAASRHLIS